MPSPLPRTPVLTIHHFDSGFAEQQSYTQDLVVYSPVLLMCTRICWPLSLNGTRLTPRELVSFMGRQNVFFPCFCSRHGGVDIPRHGGVDVRSTVFFPAEITRIIPTSSNEQVYIYCHFNPPRCSYFLDLLRIYRETILEYRYPPAMTIYPPYNGNLLANFLSGRWREEYGEYHILQPRVFPGFFGEIIATSANRPSIIEVKGFQLFDGQLGPKHAIPAKRSVSVGTQTDPTDNGRIAFVAEAEAQAIERLGRGEGLSKKDQKELWKKCPICSSLVWQRFAFEHIRACGRPDGKPRKSDRNASQSSSSRVKTLMRPAREEDYQNLVRRAEDIRRGV
ncbi:hypothetical protein B0H15DRAFT_855851 [Mycena belliarum]|uniref:Uncharacterized protein n=1 Tax=Mycena belliarum TaxID=1033014 RepID=A0AAD6XMP3_9AGAR|nr:hypothetical protein B0H15DRAFT_855851 [Mycena belliae]